VIPGTTRSSGMPIGIRSRESFMTVAELVCPENQSVSCWAEEGSRAFPGTRRALHVALGACKVSRASSGLLPP